MQHGVACLQLSREKCGKRPSESMILVQTLTHTLCITDGGGGEVHSGWVLPGRGGRGKILKNSHKCLTNTVAACVVTVVVEQYDTLFSTEYFPLGMYLVFSLEAFFSPEPESNEAERRT